MSEPTEHEKVSQEVDVVLGHLRRNRTTRSEAEQLQEAARKSVRDHSGPWGGTKQESDC